MHTSKRKKRCELGVADAPMHRWYSTNGIAFGEDFAAADKFFFGLGGINELSPTVNFILYVNIAERWHGLLACHHHSSGINATSTRCHWRGATCRRTRRCGEAIFKAGIPRHGRSSREGTTGRRSRGGSIRCCSAQETSFALVDFCTAYKSRHLEPTTYFYRRLWCLGWGMMVLMRWWARTRVWCTRTWMSTDDVIRPRGDNDVDFFLLTLCMRGQFWIKTDLRKCKRSRRFKVSTKVCTEKNTIPEAIFVSVVILSKWRGRMSCHVIPPYMNFVEESCTVNK